MNIDATIVSPSGHRMVQVGAHYWKQWSAGQYHVTVEWLTQGRSHEPILAIWPQSGGRDAGVFAIGLSSAGKHIDMDGSPTPHCVRECMAALRTMGRNNEETELYALIDVVIRHIPDLVSAPLQPVDMQRAEAPAPLLEVTTKLERAGELTMHSEVLI